MSLVTAGKELVTGVTPKILEKGLSFVLITLIAIGAIIVSIFLFNKWEAQGHKIIAMTEKQIKVTERNNIIFEELKEELKKR